MNEFQVAREAAVWVLPLDTGGCGAALQSIYALLAPHYAGSLRAQGISFARSPRHADIVLIAGPLSQAASEPIRRLLESVPQPRALVAVGNCAIDGCVFAGSPEVTANPADALDVHIEVSGCPPPPSAILTAIVEAKRLLTGEDVAEVEAEGAAEVAADAEEDEAVGAEEASDETEDAADDGDEELLESEDLDAAEDEDLEAEDLEAEDDDLAAGDAADDDLAAGGGETEGTGSSGEDKKA